MKKNKTYKKAYIEITNICNLSCKFCAKTTRKLEFMSIENFKKIILQVESQTDYLYFHLMGEPLLHQGLEELLSIAHDFDKNVVITTNGVLIEKTKQILLNSKAIYKVVISIHSFEANDIKVSLEEYINEISDFAIEASDSSKIITVLRLWNMDSKELSGNNSLNNEIYRLLEKRFNLLKMTIEEQIHAKQEQDIKLYDRVFLQIAEKFEWPILDSELKSEKAFCYGLRDHFGILVDGTVVPCCLDHNGDISLGNCLKEPLHEILTNQRAIDIYNSFSERKPTEELCKRCGFVSKL